MASRIDYIDDEGTYRSFTTQRNVVGTARSIRSGGNTICKVTHVRDSDPITMPDRDTSDPELADHRSNYGQSS